MNREEIEKIVLESANFTEVLRKMGKSVSGAAVKVLKNELDAYGIDYHLLYERNPHKCNKTIPLEEMLVKNSYVNKKNLKKRLIQAGIKQNVCECCYCEGIWQGKELVMQLHHKNGDNTDNRLENLVMLCPNCHSQTENYAGGNRKKRENHCKDCGKVISPKSTYCAKCAAKKKNRRKVENRPSKEELLDMVLHLPFTKIAENYGVSDKAIVKWCRAYGIPSTRKEIKNYINGAVV